MKDIRMKFSSFLTYRFLMIFLLLGVGMSLGEVYAQDTENHMMPVTRTFAFEDKDKHPDREDPSSKAKVAASHGFDLVTNGFRAGQSEGLENAGLSKRAVIEQYFSAGTSQQTVQANGNAIRLYMEGTDNTATAVQKEGSGNTMNLGIYGSSNKGNYLQSGSNNYIFDRIGSQENPANGVTHKIHQTGNNLSTINQGIQTIPMFIKQRGPGMQLRITGAPLP